MVNDMPVTQKSRPVADGDRVSVIAQPTPYVGIGGEKLEPAIRKYRPGKDYSALDIGASTGGFTDCLLQHGASMVTAVDIGSGQIDPSLLRNPRVRSFENSDIRTFSPELLPSSRVEVITIDVSFISLEAILPLWKKFLRPGGLVFALFKPQFQMKTRKRMRGGILKSAPLREKALADFSQAAGRAGYRELETFQTAADGKSKNVEFMVVFRYSAEESCIHDAH